MSDEKKLPAEPFSKETEQNSNEQENASSASDSSDSPSEVDTPTLKKRVKKAKSAKKISTDILPIVQDGGIDELLVMESQIPDMLPVLPLRGNVIFNSMVVPLYEGRELGIQAIEQALSAQRFVMLCTQKSENLDDPGFSDIYEVGSVAMILRMLKMPDGQLKILVQGVARAKITGKITSEPLLFAKIKVLKEKKVTIGVEQEALIRTAREQSERILKLRGIPTNDIMGVLMNVEEPGRLSDLIAANMRLQIQDAQTILECLDPIKRLRIVNEHLTHEVEVAGMQVRIQNMAREGMDKAQKDYYLREQIKAIRKELGDGASQEEEIDSLAQALETAGLPEQAKIEADKQLRRLASMNSDSAEATVVRTYLEWFADLPWKKCSRDRLDIAKAKELLENDHYGLAKIKDRILEFLSVRKLNPESKGSILCFVGPPGVGKTSLGRSIAKAMGRKFQRISMGGMRDEAEIRGHRRTYIGAMPGRIIQSIKQAGTKNPVMVLDEIDKLGNDFRGDPASALLEVLDPEQNSHFTDYYLNVEFDLSRVLFICTANNLDTIPQALRDRLEIISLSGYTEQEKLAIAKRYLLKRQIASNGLKPEDIEIRDSAISRIIREYTREAGLRNLDREIGSVCRKLARRKAEGQSGPFLVNSAMIPKLLGIPRFLDEERDKVLIPGVALGLAWTAAGGEVLHIEVTTMKGKGALILTGPLGDVMKERAQAAMSYARAHAAELGIDSDFSEKLDIHIHVPAGATPKDGPSAGVTIVSALVSALSGRPLRGDTCMTGEITLRGRVLPVGGIKEKILGGVARGLKQAVIPKQNTKDLEDVPLELRRKIHIYTVEYIEELLKIVLL